ncbi:MAG: N-acetylneuraminate synthase family protein [Candidatus Aureabacteria bacterium]|nr:N-acetylneuraminate synthase family protein [Candidatus Auribacterota bacterium]
MNIKIIAETGCNHKGSMEIAKEMINVASIFCKADCVKFQKRNLRELLSEEEYNSPHPNVNNSYGKTYGEHREVLELDLDQHRQLKKWCDEMNIMYSCSVWDLTSTKEIVSLQPKLIKIPSACNLNKDILEYLCEYYEGEIHVSFGMTSQEEEKKIIDFFKERKRNTDLVIYSCTSGYPVPFEDVCLLEIRRLLRDYSQDVKSIGFSGHHLGIAVDVAAITLGACWVERHFTLDRTWKGTDHAASLEPEGIRRLVRNAKAVSLALTNKRSEILDIENVQRKKLKEGQIKWEK